MTNYFGKNRFKKIFYNYLSDRTELLKGVQNSGLLKYADYKKYRGSEFLDFEYGDYKFRICASGSASKVISLEEYHYNENSGKYKSFNRVVSFYDEMFCPKPNNKNKVLDRYDIAKSELNSY